MGDFNPLLAFNGKLNLQTAYGYNVADIHKFINDVADKPDDFRERDPADHAKPYPDPKAQQRKADLDLLRKDLIALAAPSGPKYTTPPPPQSILRAGDQLTPAQQIPWEVNAEKEHFFATFDLLGVFLSIIGPAPTLKVPTAKNFFLPLNVVYAKWCITLVSGSGLTPNRAQITWARHDEHHPFFFFLGTNARGWGKKVPDFWQTRVKQTRHQYISRILEAQRRTWGVSPSIDKDGPRAGWNYGNCAETYPFLYLLADGMPANGIYGISLKIPSVKTHTHNWAQYWTGDSLDPPCVNCAQLIGQYHAISKHFTLWE